ncbi:uncharacterized protein LOC129754066 [Uranotaenia lowii]|uniref:uncharacterized protein LOC129754066 n=1 Tax=Uranotaenia lowii TaxID=190385 RepID=UPI002478CBC2|nr:uncharacterized protein LOC129754066 [Uranotaenia lowii]
MSTERRLKALKTRLRSIQTSFGLIKAFVDEYNDETHSDEVPVRLENLGVLWNDFLKVQGEIEAMDILEPKAIEAHLAQRVDFESLYYKVKGFLLAANKLPPSPNMPIGSSFTSHFPASSHHIRLPDIKIPTFSGNIDTWLNFHDLFVSLVHSSHELSSIQKFYYLRASLSGDAQKLIQTIPISSNNYLVAWNLLLDHFQNPSRLKQSYVDSLFEFSALKSESASDLHSLVERFEANVKILHQLGERTEYWDILLIRMLSIRLDSTTRRDWEVYATTKDSVSFQDLVAFIQRRVTVLESIKAKVPETIFSGNLRKSTQRSVSSHSAYQLNDKHCAICSENHVLYHCPRFAKMNLDTKEKEIRRLHLCRNCLRKGHLANNCSSTNCRKCRGRHHTLLCSGDSHSNKSTESTKAENSLPSQQPTTSVSASLDNPVSLASTGCIKVLLATAIVNLIDDNGTIHTARALLDSGSECCFITESLSQRMKSSRVKINLPISGIGQSLSHARHKIQTTLQSRVSNFSTTLEFIVLSKATTNLPTSCFDVSDWKIPSDINLADPAFFATNPVELILGAEIFFELLKPPGRISLGDSYPLLINSTFGWIVSGRTSNRHSTGPVMASVASVAELHRLMERFWLIEEGDSTPCHSVEEAACENHFQSTVSRTDDGRYMVRLPVKQDLLPNLGNNWNTANRRFKYLESKLSRNNDQRIQYVEFMHEYLFLGHMCEVNRAHQLDALEYFMPHHAVIRESSTTTKIRVVFDASCRSASGASLNDILMVGPVVQEDIRSIIMRARKHQIMLIGDIKQMYRQILVDPLEEIRRAERNLIRILQEQHFEEELRCLHDGKQVSSKSKLRWFHPILGIDHLLRIGGRLNKAPRTYDSKHQIILPSTHAFSTLLIRSFHLNHLHAAPQLLLSLLRMRYWVLGARNRARLIVRQCIICFKARPRLVEQFMGELPAARITATRPFAVAGIDYWGPIFLKPVHRRAASEKAFVAVFVCFSTKAVHIELVADLSTAKFIQALRRFVSRRGLCSDMHSDNGLNFLGADNELRRLVNSSSHQQAVNQECLAHGIRWHFNPPKASHFGGLWEAAIFSAQKHFIRVIGNHTLAYDDMVTLLCQIECCLNSRPITPLSDESSDLEPLTPGHFLIGSQLKAVPDNDLSDIQMNRLRKWQQTQKIFQDIWKRWHREYLCTLQARTKWCNTPVEIKPGQLVLLKDEGKIPMHWPTARITEIHPGDDGITRVVSVRSSSKVYTRPVTKICVLPFSSQPTPTEAPENSNKSGEGQSDIQGTTVPVCSKI